MPLFDILTILNCRHTKNSKYSERLSLTSPQLPKDRSSKKDTIVINTFLLPPQGVSLTKGDWLFITEETRRQQYTQSCHGLCYLSSIILKITLPWETYILSPFLINVVFNPWFQSYPLFLVVIHVYMLIYFYFIFLFLISLLPCSQKRIPKSREEIYFSPLY